MSAHDPTKSPSDPEQWDDHECGDKPMITEPDSLSDEASQDAADAKEVPRNTTAYWAWKVSWQECRRRALELIETERRKAFEAGWEAVSAFVGSPGPPRDPLIDPDMARDAAYRAFRAQEGEK